MKISLILSDSHVFVKNNIKKIVGDSTDVITYDYNNSDLDEILYDFSAVSLFGDQKYIVVDHAEDIFSKGFSSDELMNYFQNPSDLTTVIFVASKADKTNDFYKIINKTYKIFDSGDKRFTNNILAAKSYIKEKGSHISDKALDYIKEATLNNYDLMISEIDKLLILGKENISDELVYNLVALTPDGNTNKLIDALLLMNEADALKYIKNMETLNIDLTKMISLLAWNVRVVYLIKISRKDKSKLENILSTYKIPDFKYNRFVQMGNIRSEEELENIIIGLSELDEQIKRFIVTKSTVGYNLLNMFCL